MDQSALVAVQLDEGRRLVERFAADGNAIRTAFWAKDPEESTWHLYIVTDTVESAGPTDVYRAVRASLQKLTRPFVSISQVKVIGPHDPVAREVLSILARSAGHPVLQYGGPLPGWTAMDVAHVYPPQVHTFGQVNPMTTEDLGREIVRLMNRGPGALQPSQVTLKDGTRFHGVPFSLQLGTQKDLTAQFVADGEPAPRVIRLDEIASIL